MHTTLLQNGWTPLHAAAGKGCTELVHMLIQSKGNAEAANKVTQ